MKKIYRWAIKQAFLKLDPRQQIKNPVMFVVYIGAIAATVLCFEQSDIPLWVYHHDHQFTLAHIAVRKFC